MRANPTSGTLVWSDGHEVPARLAIKLGAISPYTEPQKNSLKKEIGIARFMKLEKAAIHYEKEGCISHLKSIKPTAGLKKIHSDILGYKRTLEKIQKALQEADLSTRIHLISTGLRKKKSGSLDRYKSRIERCLKETEEVLSIFEEKRSEGRPRIEILFNFFLRR